MPEWPLLVLAAVANWQLVETWRHSALFANARAWVEARGGFLAGLLGCPYCLSHWTAAGIMVLAVQQQRSNHGSVDWWLLPLYWLAIVRLSNLANDLTHGWCRTPRRDKELAAELEALNATGESAGAVADEGAGGSSSATAGVRGA